MKKYSKVIKSSLIAIPIVASTILHIVEGKSIKDRDNQIKLLEKEIDELKENRITLKPKEKQIKDSDIEYIKSLRKEGLSYGEISKRTSWSKATVCRVLNGLYD